MPKRPLLRIIWAVIAALICLALLAETILLVGS
jgi:hypothetical protein